MSRSDKGLTIIVVASLGLWGCAQGSKGKPAARNDERVKVLEAKLAQAQSEYQTEVAAREEVYRRKMAELNQERQRLAREVEQQREGSRQATHEHQELKELVATRTAERDALQLQLAEFRRGIRTLLGKVEASIPPSLDASGAASHVMPRSKL
jgi:chromosome segregation ATPase